MRYQIRSGNNFDFCVGGDPSYATFGDIDSAEESLAHLESEYPDATFQIHAIDRPGGHIIAGRYLLQCLSEVPDGDALPAGVELDSQGKYRVDGERIDPEAEYLAWNCANPRATFSEDAHMSDWSVGPA